MPRDLAWHGCVNIRDLGGFATPAGRTEFGVFVRADNARKLTPAGWRLAWEYGVRTVLDLRSDPECGADAPAPPDFVHERLSLFDHFDGDAEYRRELTARLAGADFAEKYRTLYREALQLDATRFAEAFAVLAEADGAVIFHCVGGKDRTGLLAALLLRLVGVSIEEVDADYVRSEDRLRAGSARRDDGGTPRDVVDRVLLDTEAWHGTTAAYLEQAGVAVEHLDRIRGRFLAGGP